jgi:hypothetical protein
VLLIYLNLNQKIELKTEYFLLNENLINKKREQLSLLSFLVKPLKNQPPKQYQVFDFKALFMPER